MPILIDDMRKIKIALCINFFLFISTTKAQDTIQTYRHNIKIHPVLEGITFGYEYALVGTKNNSIKASLVLKKNDVNPIIYNMSKYEEQKFDIQYRHYFSSKSPNLKGFYHAANLQLKHFKGTSSIDFFDFRLPRSPFPIKYNNNALCLGYAFGYQVMSQGGFNLDIGYMVSKQFLDGNTFQTYLFDEIPYRSYLNGVNSQLTIGMGIAF